MLFIPFVSIELGLTEYGINHGVFLCPEGDDCAEGDVGFGVGAVAGDIASHEGVKLVVLLGLLDMLDHLIGCFAVVWGYGFSRFSRFLVLFSLRLYIFEEDRIDFGLSFANFTFPDACYGEISLFVVNFNFAVSDIHLCSRVHPVWQFCSRPEFDTSSARGDLAIGNVFQVLDDRYSPGFEFSVFVEAVVEVNAAQWVVFGENNSDAMKTVLVCNNGWVICPCCRIVRRGGFTVDLEGYLGGFAMAKLLFPDDPLL